MKEKNFNSTNRFLSKQAKQALFYAISEAHKNKTDKVSLKFIFYGLVKANPSLLSRIILSLDKKNKVFSNMIKTLLYRCEKSFKNHNKTEVSLNNSLKITLSKPVRNLLYSSIRFSKNNPRCQYTNKNYLVITTFNIFLGLLKNKVIKNWLKDEIFLLKK